MYPDRDTLSNVSHAGYMHGEKWCDRRREKLCQFSFSWINTTTQTWSLKLKSNDFQVMPWVEQQLVEEKDTDSIRKVLCKSFIQWFYSFSFVFFCCCWSTLKWKSRNITKFLMLGPSGNQLVLFSLESWCFSWLCLMKHQDSQENKTNCFPRDLTLSVYYATETIWITFSTWKRLPVV